jgi:hypothetical protein
MKTWTLYGAICTIMALHYSIALAQVDVLTQHNDLSRTGWNKQETFLNHANVRPGSFGLVFTLPVDDQVYAQPLVVSGVNVSGSLKNVVFVCTMNNSVYAFDADNGTLYWQRNFIQSGFRTPNSADMHPGLCNGSYYDFGNNIGIVGTPVIDKAANTMYFVTKIASDTISHIDNHPYNYSLPDDEYNYSPSGFYQYLHAINLGNGEEKPNSPVQIKASYPGTGDGSVGGIIKFDPRRQFNRTGLVLSRGILYIAFAAHCDWNPCHGWLLGYDASTLQQKIVYNTTPNDGRGGIWMSGAAPAVDASGSLYFTTGNAIDGGTIGPGTFYHDLPSVDSNRGESVVKVTPNRPDNTATSVRISSYFTPLDYKFKNDADLDFSVQTLLIPNTNTLLTACKDDSLYLMDTTNLGGFDTTKNKVLQTVYLLKPPATGGDIHTSLAYFGGSNAQYVYQLGENTQLQAFPVKANSLGATITNKQSNTWPIGSVGGFMSVSSSGPDTSTAILWITHALNSCAFAPCPGILRAFKANDINTELWNSNNRPADNQGTFGKMCCPTIANGKVYLSNATSGTYQVMVYGLLSDPLPLDLISFTANNINDQYVQLKWSTSGETTFDHFDVERSTGGVVFSKLTEVRGETAGSGVQYYSAVDDNPLNGINYYRLKEVGLNGNIFYSKIITVNISKDPAPRISPNPANTYFTVLSGAEPIEEINLLDASGKKIEHVVNGYSSTSVTVATGSLAAGIYIVEIKTASHAYHQKLFKQ